MEKRNIIHDGVSIKIFETDDPQKVIIHFTDEITAYNKIKKAVIKDKGIYCNGVSCEISRLLQKGGVPTHFIEQISDTEQLCWKSEVIPMEVIVRNVIAGSMPRGWDWRKASCRRNRSMISATNRTSYATLSSMTTTPWPSALLTKRSLSGYIH